MIPILVLLLYILLISALPSIYFETMQIWMLALYLSVLLFIYMTEEVDVKILMTMCFE
jgi:hypothetical protein